MAKQDNFSPKVSLKKAQERLSAESEGCAMQNICIANTCTI